MKTLSCSGAALGLGFGLFILAAQLAHATISVESDLTYGSVTINPASGTVQYIAALQSTTFAQAGANAQFNTGAPSSVTDVPVPGGSATGAGTSSVSPFSGTSSATGFIPGTTAGFDTSAGRASANGVFIIDSTQTGPVSVSFSAIINGQITLKSDSYGVLGEGETVFSLSLNGVPILFNDQIASIGPDETKTVPVSETLTETLQLQYNTAYWLWLEGDSETLVVNSSVSAVPEPVAGSVAAGCLLLALLGFSLVRQRLTAKAAKRGMFMLAGGTLMGLVIPAQAMYIGSDAPDVCLTCGVQATRQQAGGNSSTSWSEGNSREDYPIPSVTSGYGATLPFALTYNSYNADGSKAQLDTGLGFGWTHTYNTLLFQQRGQMFRLGADGRVTQYFMNFTGTGGTYVSDAGYFETLTMQTDGTFFITNKNQSWWHFGSVPGTPFLVAGPVYRLLQMGDRNQNSNTMAYNASGLLTSVTDPFGRALTFGYNVSNKLSSVTDPLGHTTTFQYDPQDRTITSITDPNGKTIQYTYNSQYQMTRKVDRDGRMYFYMYKGLHPFAVTDGNGQPWLSLTNPSNWAVDPTALAFSMRRQYIPSTTTSTDGNSNTWKYTYDTNGYIDRVTAPDGTTTSYSYDPGSHLVTSITNANGNVTRYQYDAEGNRTNITDAMGNVTVYTYEPAFNMVTSMTDPNGRTTTYQYDGNGNRIREIDPLIHTNTWTYDGNGNVTSTTDKNGHTTTYQYDSFGERIKMTDPLGDVTTYKYDADGNRTNMTDANGHVTQYQYDADNRLIKTTDALGHSTTAVYDGFGRMTTMTDRNGNVTTYDYDVRGRLATTTDALSGVTSNAYDADDNRISTTDPLGHTTTYQYDSRNRIITGTNAIDGVIRYTYDPFGNRISATDPNTNITTYAYDALNRQIKMTDALGGVTTYDYSTTGSPACCSPSIGSPLITRVEDPDGNVTFYHYDEINRRTQVVRKNSDTNDTINPTDAVTTSTYDAVGNVLAVTDPSTNTTTYAYDALNRQTIMVNAAGDTTVTAYDPVGNLITTVAPNNNHVTNNYDALNRVITIYDEVGPVRTNTYDAVGNLTSMSDALGDTTSYTYDGLNRRVTMTDALGNTATTAYDADSNVTSVTDRNGHATTYVYDGLNRRTSAADPLGNTTVTAYDADNNMLSVTDANGHATTYTYDALNRRVTETYPDAAPNTRTNVYDAVGNVITRTDEKGQVTTYSYNSLYYLTNRAYSPSGSTDTFTYDPGGRVLGATRNGWVDAFGYDGANRLTSSTQNGLTFTYAYDIADRLQTNSEPSGRTLVYTYDARNRLASLQDGTPNPPIVNYTYDDANRILTRTNRNGTTSTYTYNADNWITSLEHSNSVGRIAGFGYTYDNEGNKLDEEKRDHATRSEAYGYDAANRLTSYDIGTLTGSMIPSPSGQTSYSLDPVGNWNSVTSNSVPQTRTHGTDNELLTTTTPTATNHFIYDADGNLNQDTNYNYSYDEENRLIQVQRRSDSAIVGQYQYDALSRRALSITNPAGTAGTNMYYYDNARLMEERDGSGVLNATYTYGNYIDEVVTMDRGGQTYYYHANALWTPYALSDASGSVAERYSYDVYGAVTVLDASYNPLPLNSWGTPHSAVGNPWLFTGRQLDEEDGLYFYRARYYDAGLGRFLQRDPVEYVTSLNLYEYVRSAPTFYVDPSGAVCAGGNWSPFSVGKGAGNRKLKAGFGFVSGSFSIAPEFVLEACTSECCAHSQNPGKTVEDWRGTVGVAYDLSLSASTWGGTVSLGPVDATAWLGLRGTVGASGKVQIGLGSDNCNNKPLVGVGCFSVSPYGEVAVGGEVAFSAGWFNFNNGITGSARISATWKVCVKCTLSDCDVTSFKYMGGSVDFQLKGCLAYFGCVQSGFSLSF